MKLTYLKQHPIRTFFIGIVALFFLNITYDLLHIAFFAKEYKYEPDCHWRKGCPTHVFGNGAFQIKGSATRGFYLTHIADHLNDGDIFSYAISSFAISYFEFKDFGYVKGIENKRKNDKIEKIETYLLLDLKVESYTTYKTLAEIPKEHQGNFKKMIPLE